MRCALKGLAVLALVLVVFISLFMYLFVQAHDYAVPLGKGYRYFGAKKGITVIDRGALSEAETNRIDQACLKAAEKGADYDVYDVGLPYVGPNVDGYRVYPRVITGHVSRPKGDYEVLNRNYEKEGYFVIDTTTNTVKRGLGRQEWMTRIRKYGLYQEPKLLRPTGRREQPGVE